MVSSVAETAAADPADVIAHFSHLLALETDCADVQGAISAGEQDFILLDVRGPAAYAKAHVPGAINLPRRLMSAETLSVWPEDSLFVVYCAGPHCNGADRGALRLAQMGRRVKIMIGGMTGWADEGFDFEGADPGVAPGRCVI